MLQRVAKCCSAVALALVLQLYVDGPTSAAQQSTPSSAPRKMDEASIGVPQKILDEQYATVLRMRPEFVTYMPNGSIRSIRGDLGIDLADLSRSDVPPQAIEALFEVLKPLLLTRGAEQFVLADRSRILGAVSIRFTQKIDGIPVVPSGVTLVSSRDSTRVVSLGAHILHDRGLERLPAVRPTTAAATAIAAMEGSAPATIVGKPELTYFLVEESGKGVLGWRVSLKDQSGLPWIVDIDARSGAVLRRVKDSTQFSPNRVIHEGNVYSTTPTLTEGGSSGNPNVNGVYQNLGSVYGLFSTLSWYSLDGANLWPQVAVVNLGAGDGASYTTAAQFPPPRLYFFDGSAGFTRPWGNALDVVAHEFMHGVIDRLKGLTGGTVSSGDAAGVMEGLSDVAGIWASAGSQNIGDQQNRYVSGRVFLSAPSIGLRSASNPLNPAMHNFGMGTPRDWYPERSDRLYHEGAGHLNATIVSHAYFILTQGGQHSRVGASVRGGPIPAITVNTIPGFLAERIFFEAIGALPPISPTMIDLRNATESVASTYGQTYRDSVSLSWQAVGVGTCDGGTPPAVPSGLEVGDYFCMGQYDFSWPQVARATTYTMQVSSNEWFLSPQTAVDGPVTSCAQNFTAPAFVRLRACNGCGCSSWSPARYMYYYSPCL